MMQDVSGDEASAFDIVKTTFQGDVKTLEVKVLKSIKACEEFFKTVLSKLHHHAVHLGAAEDTSIVEASSAGSLSKDQELELGGAHFLKIVIKEILGINTSRFSADESLSCRLVSVAGGSVDITAMRDGDVFYFSEEQRVVFRGLRDEGLLDKIVVRVQVYRMSVLDSTNPTFVGAVDFSLREIDYKAVTFVEKEFIQSVSNSVCTLSIIVVPPSTAATSPKALRGVTRKTKLK
jgi:hypothetical protein